MSETREIFETMGYGPAPEGAEPAMEWLDARGRRFGLFVNGAWTHPSDAERFDTLNPATGAPLASISQGSEGEVDQAVRAARRAFAEWSSRPGHERARFLYALARHIQKHSRLFSVLETLDNGKPIREARDIDIPLVARHFYHHAGWAQLLTDEFPGHEPVGVVGQVIPWNFPLLMLAWKVAPALAAGNTVVLKPAEFTSLTALLFAEACQAIGLPPGVFNVVTGDGRTGAALVAHPDIDKVAFTGSTEVGRLIRTATAGSGKKLSLELGGKSPFVVFDDADLDSVVEGVVDAIWFNQGQVCCAGSRILVHEGIAEDLERKLKARMEKLRIGNPLDKAVDMGAIVDESQLERIREMVSRGAEEGATVWHPQGGLPQEGWFYPPTLCTNVQPTDLLAQEEVFGPVVAMMTFRTPGEAVELANNSRYGLAASVWTENRNLALDVAPAIKAGTVWINSTNVFDAASGFGGYRESGYGREGGKEGMYEYLRPSAAAGPPGGEDAPREEDRPVLRTVEPEPVAAVDPGTSVDRTLKHYVGGKQVRPDSGYSLWLKSAEGRMVAEVGRGNRKDVRNAVEAAARASRTWGGTTAHARAQILYFLAENLSLRSEELRGRLRGLGIHGDAAEREVEASVQRLFGYAAWADKWEGRVHRTPFRNVTLAMPEPMGVMGIVPAPNPPLLGLVSAVAPAIAMGNTVVVLALEGAALAAGDLYQVLETSDVPPGVVNLVTGLEEELLPTLADHDAIDALWYFGSRHGSREVELRSVGNMKRTWVDYGRPRDWFSQEQGQGEEFLREAVQVKNIWIPYGE